MSRWLRRPSAPDTTAPVVRARTTSGSILEAFRLKAKRDKISSGSDSDWSSTPSSAKGLFDSDPFARHVADNTHLKSSGSSSASSSPATLSAAEMHAHASAADWPASSSNMRPIYSLSMRSMTALASGIVRGLDSLPTADSTPNASALSVRDTTPRPQEADLDNYQFIVQGDSIDLDDDWPDSRLAPGKRPPPSPTTMPWVAGNAGRRHGDLVYPSGVHTIPQAALGSLARLDEPTDSDLTTRTSSSDSSFAPETVPPSVDSRVEFARHARSPSYSDSELDLDWDSPQDRIRPMNAAAHKRPIASPTQTAVAWRCGSGNPEKCCQTRALRDDLAAYKCCAERAQPGKHAMCCAAFVGRPCQRARASSTSSVSVHEVTRALGRQRSFHLSSLPGMSTSPTAANRKNRFFHRPHTSHGKSTSSALLDDETKAIISRKSGSREDPGPSSTTDEIASPPMSPLSKQEFKAQYILPPSKLHEEMGEPSVLPRQRSNTTATDMRPLAPRRNLNISLPVASTPIVAEPRRYVQSISAVVGPAGGLSPPPTVRWQAEMGVDTTRLQGGLQGGLSPRSPGTLSRMPSGSLSRMPSGSLSRMPAGSLSQAASLAPRSPVGSLRSPSLAPRSPALSPRPSVGSLSPRPSVGSPLPRSPVARSGGLGLPPPPRRIGPQPIASFVLPDRPVAGPDSMRLRHYDSYDSVRTVRRERSMPLRQQQESFLEFEEDGESEAGDPVEAPDMGHWHRPSLHHSQSFLELGSRQSGDTICENMAMFS